MTFKLYRAESGQVSEAVEGVVFSEGSMVGNSAQPFRFRNRHDIDHLTLSGNTLFYFAQTGDTLGTLALVDETGQVPAGEFSLVNGDLGTDNDLFSIAGSALVWEGDVYGLNRDTLTVHIRGMAPTGCSLDRVIHIQVLINDLPPTGWVADTLFAPENEPPGYLVGTLAAIDETPGDAHTFAFEDGENTPDHVAFAIIGAELRTARTLDFERQNTYRLNIRITDLSGLYVVAPLTVMVTDVPEPGDLKAGNLVTPNGDGHNDTFYIPNLGMYPNHELMIYNALGNKVFETKRYDNGWDGHTDSGTALPTGTYYYIFQDLGNSDNSYKGEIHLYRENKF